MVGHIFRIIVHLNGSEKPYMLILILILYSTKATIYHYIKWLIFNDIQ